MKILGLSAVIPCARQDVAGVTAVHVVIYSLLDELTRLGHQVVYQPVFTRHRASETLAPFEQESIQALAARGIDVLPPISASSYLNGGGRGVAGQFSRLGALLGGTRLAHFYPSVSVAPQISAVVDRHRPDVALTFWSPEAVAATHGVESLPCVSYQGDVDFVPGRTRQSEPALFFPARNGSLRDRLDRVRSGLWYAEAARAHLRLMRGVACIANVTAANADYYTAQGHPRAVYARNTWPDPGPSRLAPLTAPATGPFKIIGHVGYLDRTGSTYGLKFLLTDVMPHLRQTLAGLDYEVHIIGGGQPVPALRPLLKQERLVVRGFVEDLEAEFASSSAMLVLNGASPYRCAYTRHLVAWSHRLCLIVHEYSRGAIPEIVHLENALVGRTGAEVAEQIRVALTDPATNAKVRQGGLRTYQQYFTPAAVAKGLESELQVAVSTHRSGRSAQAPAPSRVG